MSPTNSGLATPDFGARSRGGSSRGNARPGNASSGGSIPPDLAARFADCAQAHTELVSGETRIRVAAPWAGERTLPVQATASDTAAALAARIVNDASLREANRRAGFGFVSITLLSNTGIGRALQVELERRGFRLRVYEASGPLDTADNNFTISEGGHWDIYGVRTRTHNFALTDELIRAREASFEYAQLPDGGGERFALSDRAGLLELLLLRESKKVSRNILIR
jgi:hypothetical protein